MPSLVAAVRVTVERASEHLCWHKHHHTQYEAEDALPAGHVERLLSRCALQDMLLQDGVTGVEELATQERQHAHYQRMLVYRMMLLDLLVLAIEEGKLRLCHDNKAASDDQSEAEVLGHRVAPAEHCHREKHDEDKAE